jgi:cell division protein FtsB
MSADRSKKPKRLSSESEGRKPVKRESTGNAPKKSSAKSSEKRRIGFLGRWYVILPVALILLGALTFAWYYQPLQIWYYNARDVRVLREQKAAIDEYNAQLKDEIASLETTEGVADYARRELNLIKRGDHVVVVTRDGEQVEPEEDSRVTAIESLGETAEPFGTWTDFLDSLFGSR